MTTSYPPQDPQPSGSEPGYNGPEPQYPAPDPRYVGQHPYYAYPAYGYPYAPMPAPTPPHAAKRRRLLAAGVATIAAAAVFGGVAVAESHSNTTSGTGAMGTIWPGTDNGSGGSGSGNGGTGVLPGSGGGTGVLPGSGGNGGTGGTGSNGTASVSVATARQQKGVVTINSVLQYQNAESAGTGMILSSDGEILTNNHVVNGATSITVTVESTGRSYRADVVGTDPSDDVAVLKLRNASGLTKANVGDSSDVKVGDAVVGVGNAGGTGTLRASKGAVTALNQSITATDESGQAGERLTDLIQVNADIISGDSGGPLYDADGEIVGMDTAASADQTVQSTAYAIPIDNALKIADKIETGVETSKIHIGLPAFLGVGVGDSTTQGAAVTSLLDGGPAASAGITSGSVITKVGGTAVTSADGLKTALQPYEPGQKATVTWIGADGASHTATVTLGSGPAD